MPDLSSDEDDALSLIRDLLAESIALIPSNQSRGRLRLRFGVDDGSALTLAAIGLTEGVSREAIRQNELKFLRRFGRAASRDGTAESRLRHQLLGYSGIPSKSEDRDAIVERLSISPSPIERVFPGVQFSTAIRWMIAFCGFKRPREIANQILRARETHQVDRRARARDDRREATRVAVAGVRLERLVAATLWCGIEVPSARERSAPVRRVNFNQGSEPPYFASEKTGSLVGFESILELQTIETLEDAIEVEWYTEQPVFIPFTFRGSSRRYVPDLLVHLRDGRVLLVEVKPLIDAPLALNLAKFSAALTYCERFGWGFVIAAEPSRGPLLEVLPRFIDATFEEVLKLRLQDGPLSFYQYRQLFPNVKLMPLVTAIIRMGLEFERPFHLSLSEDPPCEFSLRAAKQMEVT